MEQEMTEHTSTSDLFSPALELSAVNAISSLGTGCIFGDAVYEILVRTMLIGDGLSTGAICSRHHPGCALPQPGPAGRQGAATAYGGGTGLFPQRPQRRGKTYPQEQPLEPSIPKPPAWKRCLARCIF